MFRLLFAHMPLLIAGALSACATVPTSLPGAAPIETRTSVTILISIDGFRADYLTRGVTPNLNALAANGVSAAMRPSFPSITFPNHYALVTGLRPDRNGIVSNKFEDAGHPGMTFTMASVEPFWWAEAEPIWTTAEKAGVQTATMFWPGSDIDHDGVRPHDWQMYGHDISIRQRVDGVIDWLRRPTANRPRFLTVYFDTVDTAGHKFGPDSAETTKAVAEVDAAIGKLASDLVALGQPANLVIVADHGMAATSPDRVILLDKIVDPKDFRFIYGGSYGAIEAVPGHEAALEPKLLAPHPHMSCTRKGDVPATFHYGRNPRVPAYVCVVDTGWLLFGTAPDKPVKPGGAHGYDPRTPEMAALFIASGPAIRAGGKLPPFDNVDVYPLVAQLIGVVPRPGDGDAAVLAPALTARP